MGGHSAPIQQTSVFDSGNYTLTAGGAINGLNLFLPLKSPAQMPALLQAIGAKMDTTREALRGLHYVHFARFVPSADFSTLMVITEFDGDLQSYIMDFVAVMGDIFTVILDFVQDAPRLPVQKYPDDFWSFIQRQNLDNPGFQPWSAYQDLTVIQILHDCRQPTAPAKTVSAPTVPPTLDLADIQSHILRGYTAESARHFALAVWNAATARQWLAALTSGDERAYPQVSSAAPWTARPDYRLQIGFTGDGLRALGVDDTIVDKFPLAFWKGSAARADAVADVDGCAPEHWVVGGPKTPAVHILLSLYARHHAALARVADTLRSSFPRFGLNEISYHDAEALPGGREFYGNKVHFGYRDGIAQPRIKGAPSDRHPDAQPDCDAGEFLLGKDYVNQYGGNFRCDLPSAFVDNASYGAFRILKQDCRAFETYLEVAGRRYNLDAELLAAKMMGRWRNGAPLALSPETAASATPIPERDINNFDFEPADPSLYHDGEGIRCPIGSHIRRMNPRGALVTGKPHSRRIIRRAMPYGPPYDHGRPDDNERGLIGFFICGDLEMQFEFLQGVWANKDIATHGLSGTRDPVLGAHPATGGKFIIRTDDARDPITLVDLPRFVETRGSLYVLFPGLGGLRWLAAL